MRSNLILLAAFALFASACTVGLDNGPKDDELAIGQNLKNLSPLLDRQGNEKSKIVIFDKTTRRINQFDLGSMTRDRSLKVTNSTADHSLLYDQGGAFIIDLSPAHVTVFDSHGFAQDQPVTLPGHPKAGAFRPDLGLAVVQDDEASVAILQVDETGRIRHSWLGGPLIDSSSTIAAGDINDKGQLILALSDGSIAIVDCDQTIKQKKWVFTKFASPLTNLSWLAPVTGKPDQIFVKGDSALAVISLSGQNILNQVPMSNFDVIKLSKILDPHIILYTALGVQLAYVADSKVQVTTSYAKIDQPLVSQLNIAADTWTIIDTQSIDYLTTTDADSITTARKLKRFRVSDLLLSSTMDIPDKAQVELASDYLFALYPSELGYAEKYNIGDSKPAAKIEHFNMNDY